ncbi:unnamed protein product [Leptosia nina]|uniref:Rho-GAP domain-containing protein n=1 Tax=Leptosia nina TaxID=320188 RepID=A0AAV1J1W2_9NEOP
MSGSSVTTPSGDPSFLDERDLEPRTPMKRLGSTRKLAAFNNIRVQLSEQARVVEARAEAAASAAGELHEYCRRRADLEHEYARSLDKLARAAAPSARRLKRDHAALACLTAALDTTRQLAKDHAALADLYAGPLASRLQRAADDVLRLHRKCRDIVAERQEEIGAALAEAAVAGKAHAAAAQEWRATALKLRNAHAARDASLAVDPPRHKKLKALDKELEKRRARHSEARARALRARADYVLSLEAANATLQRYYLDDIADIMLCSEVGFETVVGRAVRTAGAAEGARAAALASAARALAGAADALDAFADRQRTVSAHPAAFALPRPLPYAGEPPPQQDASMREIVGGAAPEADEASEAVRRELTQRLAQLEAAARSLRAECREHAKTLDAAEAELVRQMEGPDSHWDVSGLFGVAMSAPAYVSSPAPPASHEDDDAPKKDQEDYYLAKFRSYVSCAGRLARLESKAAAVRERLLPASPSSSSGGPLRSPPSPPRRAGAGGRRRGHFAAPLDDRLPTPLVSCVRVIAGYGLRHQGIFRVSGSQVEMQALRAAFERGEDPLVNVRDASDMNSVCGLLKLYLRELRPPLLPPQLQERLVRIAALPDDAVFVARLRDTLALLPLPALLVLRYLFAFLAHLAEHSEHNMMDAWNLAICLGPTLLPAWGEGGDQVAAQNLVNELVKRTIVHHRDVFPQDLAPHTLYRRPSLTVDADRSSFSESEVYGEEGGGEEEPEAGGSARDDSLYAHIDTEGELSDDPAEEEEEAWSEPRDRCVPEEERLAQPERARSPTPDAELAAVAAAPHPLTADACALAESTPDLVLDLPARELGGPSCPADTFLHNRDTLKKRPAPPAPHASAAPAPASPVPARNTLRVAAKFAELTLTGGSLKPALAAKPALLRRPTPPATAPAAPPQHEDSSRQLPH